MEFDVDLSTGRISFIDQQLTGIAINHAVARVTYQLGDGQRRIAQLEGLEASIENIEIIDAHGIGRQWEFHGQPNPDGIELTYRINRYETHPFILLQLSFSNISHEPITLDELCLFDANPSTGSSLSLSKSGEGYRFFKVGWHGWGYTGWRTATDKDRITWTEGLTSLSYSNPATPRLTGQGKFCSEGWGILEGTNSAIVAGFSSTANQFGQVYACLRPGQEALRLTCQADGIRLDPEEKVESDWGYLQFGSLRNESPQIEYIEAVSRQMQARVPASSPPVMWTHWYQFYHNVDEGRFLHNLDQLAENSDIFPCQVAELDDGYQSAWGDWTVTNSKFPHGLQWLAKEISSRGFRPGIWIAPFSVQITARVAQEHPDWMVKDMKGKPARAAFVYNMFVTALDLTHPEVLEHIRQIAHTLTQDWGYGLLKIDFLNSAALPGQRFNPKMTRAQALRSGLEAIRQGAGRETLLLGCGCPFGPAIGVVDAMRIGPDTAPSWEPYFNWLRWAEPLIKRNPSMPALRNAMRHTILLSSLNRKWWWNDPDCLLVRDIDTHLTDAEVQGFVSLVGLSGGMLISSDDLSKVSKARLRWLSLLVPNLGLAGNPGVNKTGEVPNLYYVKVEHDGNAWTLVILFNWLEKPADCRLRFTELGYPPGTPIHLFDFWDQKYQWMTESEMVFEQVPAHGCKLLRLTEATQTPQLVGDTLHISQGMELGSLRIADHRVEMETIDLGRRVAGELWLAIGGTPNPAKCNGEKVMMDERRRGIYVLAVQFMGKATIQIDLSE